MQSNACSKLILCQFQILESKEPGDLPDLVPDVDDSESESEDEQVDIELESEGDQVGSELESENEQVYQTGKFLKVYKNFSAMHV